MISVELATITAGMANSTMNWVTRIAQTKRGMRFSDMPGARILKMVVISATATSIAESSLKVTSCAQMSAPLPGV